MPGKGVIANIVGTKWKIDWQASFLNLKEKIAETDHLNIADRRKNHNAICESYMTAKKKLTKSLLMVVYFFPPLAGAGAQRPLKFAKFLPNFGWRPVILTVKNPDWYYAMDFDLLHDVPRSALIKRSIMIKSAWLYYLLNPLRVKAFEKRISRLFIQPDNQIGWIPFAYWRAKDLIAKGEITCIYTTSGPLSSHIIGLLLKQRTGLPWIADFRDEWVDQPKMVFCQSISQKIPLFP